MTVFADSTTPRPDKRPGMTRGEARDRLAGRGGRHAPAATAHASATVKEIIRLLEQSRARTHFSTSEHFNRALRLWEAASRRAEMDEWLTLCTGMERALAPLSEAFARLIQHATSSYEDAIGLVYMTLNLGDVRKGQYFTPFALARMMAQMTLADWQPPDSDGPPAIFHEPACGSGVMFLGEMAVLEERFPESFPVLLRQGRVLFRGIDIDPTAILMATLNLRLRGYPFAAETLTVENALDRPRPPDPPEISSSASESETPLVSAPLTFAAEESTNGASTGPDVPEQYLFF